MRNFSSLSLPTPADIDEEFFSGAREIRCLNSAEGLLAPAKIFLESAFEAVFIDPYFKVTSPTSLLALNEFAKYSCEATHCSTFVIYTKSPTLSSWYLLVLNDNKISHL